MILSKHIRPLTLGTRLFVIGGGNVVSQVQKAPRIVNVNYQQGQGFSTNGEGNKALTLRANKRARKENTGLAGFIRY